MYQRVWHMSVYTSKKPRVHNCEDTSAKQSCRHLEQNTTWLAAHSSNFQNLTPNPVVTEHVENMKQKSCKDIEHI